MAPSPKKKKHMTREQLFARLRRRGRANAAKVDLDIHKICSREAAVMMCDSSGFTRKTAEYGILQFLANMVQVYDGLGPVVRRRKGDVISQGADNLLAVFPDCAAAAACALDIHKWLARRNKDRHDSETFNLCIGIHWGRLLRLENDVFGDAVNLASKIGEDLAGRDETLLTKEAAAALPPRYKASYVRSTEIGGRLIELHRLKS